MLKSKLILAFVDADWVGGAAALVQFLRSDNRLARRTIASIEQVALADSRERIDIFSLNDFRKKLITHKVGIQIATYLRLLRKLIGISPRFVS